MVSESFVIEKYTIESLTLHLSLASVLQCVYTPPVICCDCGISSQHDYHGKYRLKMLCKEPVRMLRYLFPLPGIFVISWKSRALVWKSTRRIKAAKCKHFKWIPFLDQVRNCPCKLRVRRGEYSMLGCCFGARATMTSILALLPLPDVSSRHSER